MKIREPRSAYWFADWFVDLSVAVILTGVAVFVIALIAEPILTRDPPSKNPYQCSRNMKELGVVIQLYANDFDGHLPSSALVSGSPKWSRNDFIKFATRTGQLDPKGARVTYKNIVYDYAKSKDIFWCSYDTMRDQAEKQSTKASYYWKLTIDKAWYGEGCSKPYRKIDDYPYAAETVILYERQGFHDGNKPLSNGTKINVTFLDSHVKHIILKNATTGDPVNCAANADGEPMYFNYDYKADKGLPDDKTPAKWVDPARYGDKL